jgi:sarcosine oxidase subunit gamma
VTAEPTSRESRVARESALTHLGPALRATRGGGAVLAEAPRQAMLSLRLDPDGAPAHRVGAALGLSLPAACSETAAAGAHTVLWLGPDEWLVVSTGPDPAELADLVTRAIAGERGSAVDVSANRTILELSGERAGDVLAKGCPADLHPRSFGPGRAITTTLARVPLVLWQTAPDRYRLLPRTSFADYVARWILDAATEFAPPRAGAPERASARVLGH